MAMKLPSTFSLAGIPFGVEYLRALDADFLMGLVYQLMDYAPLVPLKSPDESLKTTERILKIVVDNSPGLSQAYFILARCLFLHSDWDAADRMIEECLQKNDTIADAYLLRAEIKLMKGHVADADSCLNTGLSFNFSVRDSSLFHLIKAKVHKHEAEHVMSEALEQWKGKPEEQQLLLMNAQLHVSKGDVDGALAILNTVQPGQPNYNAARIKMAEIYLEEKRDKSMFTVCYRELLKSAPTPATYALLGDAYMSVQEPEKAIEVYEMALKMQSKDMALTEKIGEAYVLCHLYSKAVNFYESVMNSTKDKRMRLKLADLLHRLGNTEKCMRILRQPLDEEPNPTDPTTISAHVQYLKLLSEVQFAGGKHTEALSDLKEILCSQAEIYSNAHDHRMVIECYKEALTYYETDIKTILALASRYMNINRLAECKQMCEMALAIDRNNDEATLANHSLNQAGVYWFQMVADMLYTNNDTDKAIVHFAQLLEKYPS
ncbi:unnamed protein product [Heligmosomoides polygyrus]|uniref:TPR_REGION domain-containing protein n=1 Tax=Heligmosomoides polygyrus TaxID=6339 RepID=A0A183FL48_HELPZ|nr:unnamed protein product [Heligmosomoides polygyrus]